MRMCLLGLIISASVLTHPTEGVVTTQATGTKAYWAKCCVLITRKWKTHPLTYLTFHMGLIEHSFDVATLSIRNILQTKLKITFIYNQCSLYPDSASWLTENISDSPNPDVFSVKKFERFDWKGSLVSLLMHYSAPPHPWGDMDQHIVGQYTLRSLGNLGNSLKWFWRVKVRKVLYMCRFNRIKCIYCRLYIRHVSHTVYSWLEQSILVLLVWLVHIQTAAEQHNCIWCQRKYGSGCKKTLTCRGQCRNRWSPSISWTCFNLTKHFTQTQQLCDSTSWRGKQKNKKRLGENKTDSEINQILQANKDSKTV